MNAGPQEKISDEKIQVSHDNETVITILQEIGLRTHFHCYYLSPYTFSWER